MTNINFFVYFIGGVSCVYWICKIVLFFLRVHDDDI